MRRLVRLLRDQAGIPVRSPAHQVPPFRALPWNWSAVGQVHAFSDLLVGMEFRVNFEPVLVTRNDGTEIGAEDDLMGPSNSYVNYVPLPLGSSVDIDDRKLFPGFPEGWYGWISHVDVAAFANEDVTTKPIHRYVRWSMLIDGVPVPGYDKTHLSGTFAFVRPPSYMHQGMTTTVLPLPLHVPIREKQQLDINVFVGVTGLIVPWAIDVCVRANGYRIPSRGPEGTIYETLMD